MAINFWVWCRDEYYLVKKSETVQCPILHLEFWICLLGCFMAFSYFFFTFFHTYQRWKCFIVNQNQLESHSWSDVPLVLTYCLRFQYMYHSPLATRRRDESNLGSLWWSTRGPCCPALRRRWGRICSTGTLCSWNQLRNSSRNNSLWPIQLGHTLLSLLRFCSPMVRTQHICSTAKYNGSQDIKSSGETTFNVFSVWEL